MAGEADGEVVVPPTLQALLAARLGQLETAEAQRCSRGAAIEGELFHQGAVHALSPEKTQVTPHLAALVRKELIRPEKSQLTGDDGFRFRHLLLRDAAYEALPKAVRAELHERYATWLDQHEADLVELDEVLGYHLEQAYRYRAELGTPDDGTLAAAAQRRLTAGGYPRAATPPGLRRAVSLFGRATALTGRRGSTSPSKPSSATPCSGQAGGTKRSGAQMPSPSAPHSRVIVSASSAGGCWEACYASTSTGRRNGEAGRAHRAKVPSAQRSGPNGDGHARWTHRWRPVSRPSSTLAGRAISRPRSRAHWPTIAFSARHTRLGTARVAR